MHLQVMVIWLWLLMLWNRKLMCIDLENQRTNLAHLCVLATQSCPVLCDPLDYSSPGFPVLGILQARILEWVSMPSSKGSNVGSMLPALTGGFFTTSATWEAEGRKGKS